MNTVSATILNFSYSSIWEACRGVEEFNANGLAGSGFNSGCAAAGTGVSCCWHWGLLLLYCAGVAVLSELLSV